MKKKTQLTGTKWYIVLMQICSVLPVLYILILSGYVGMFAKKNLFSVLFDIGISALPRAETAALSLLYRVTGNEIAVAMALPVTALLLGLLLKRLLTGKADKATRIALAVLVGADLILRVLPFSFNTVFGTAAAIAGFVIRLGCLACLIYDFVKVRKPSE